MVLHPVLVVPVLAVPILVVPVLHAAWCSIQALLSQSLLSQLLASSSKIFQLFRSVLAQTLPYKGFVILHILAAPVLAVLAVVEVHLLSWWSFKSSKADPHRGLHQGPDRSIIHLG